MRFKDLLKETIKPYRFADIHTKEENDQIKELIGLSKNDKWLKDLKPDIMINQAIPIYEAEGYSKIIGFYTIALSMSNDVRLERVFIHPDYRKMGYAKEIVKRFYMQYPNAVMIIHKSNEGMLKVLKGLDIEKIKDHADKINHGIYGNRNYHKNKEWTKD